MHVIAEVSGDTIHLKETEMIAIFACPLPQGMLAPDLDFVSFRFFAASCS